MVRFDPFDDRFGRSGQRAPFDAVRDDEGLTLYFDLPGHRAADIDLTFDRGVLTLAAERSDDATTDATTGDAPARTVVRRERPTGRLSRRLRLGDGYDGEAIGADFTDGVLTVTLPVRETAKPRRVTIGVGPEASAVEAA